MPAVQTDGDANDAGGIVSGGVASVRVNGKPVTVDGNPVTEHAPWKPAKIHKPHIAATTTGGSGSVKAGGIGIITTGCADTCGHSRVGGSGDVKVG
jgi:uncharacterized Zn-binding protein involved in type VI secretion